MCHERWALHVVIKRKFFYIYSTQYRNVQRLRSGRDIKIIGSAPDADGVVWHMGLQAVAFRLHVK